MLLEFTKKGIYCEKGNFYIDPTSRVDYALVTHAHSDHARKGSKHYLAHKNTSAILKFRLGANIIVQEVEYGQDVNINGIKVTFFPSGHVIGSSQIRVSDGKEAWVVAGDYKLEHDGITTQFEHIECTHFVTESTFAKPNFSWEPQSVVFEQINNWWENNSLKGVTSVISAYSLGKSQRLLKNIKSSIGKIVVHDSIAETNSIIKSLGFDLPNTFLFSEISAEDLKGALVITPSFSTLNQIGDKLEGYVTANASGWMQVPWFMSKSLDRGFIISDHADWNGLITAVKESKAENIYVVHGFTTYFAKHLNSIGFNAMAITDKRLDQLRLI